MAGPPRPLNPKQERFVAEYLKDLNATQAAIRAGYSARTATEQASRLLTNINVAAAVAAGQDARAKKVGIEAETVLREVARLALYDPRELFKEDGSTKLPHEIDDDTAAAISGIDTELDADGKVTKIKYRMADKNSAADKLMKHLGLFERDNRQKGDELGKLLAFLNERGSRFPVRR